MSKLEDLSKMKDILNVSEYYERLFQSFDNADKIDVDLSKTFISEAIYFHIFKMKYIGWKHRVNFNRLYKHTFSDMFQDIFAYYLKLSLPDKYCIVLEEKAEKVRPDILIKIADTPVFLIELKINIGWSRNMEFSNRIKQLCHEFNISEDNIIYVFENPENNKRAFYEQYWDKENARPKTRPTEKPLSFIYPLFIDTDPYYLKDYQEFKRKGRYPLITDEEILNKASKSIVTPFEKIVELIIQRTSIHAT